MTLEKGEESLVSGEFCTSWNKNLISVPTSMKPFWKVRVAYTR